MKFIKLFILTLFSFSGLSQNLNMDLLTAARTDLFMDQENWQKRLLDLSEDISVEDFELKLEVLNIVQRASLASKSEVICVRQGFLSQVYLELSTLMKWETANRQGQLEMPMILCDIIPNKIDLSLPADTRKEVKVYGFNIKEDTKVIVQNELDGENMRFAKNSLSKSDYSLTVKLDNVDSNLDRFVRDVEEQNASGIIYTMIFESSEGNYKDWIEVSPRTYNGQEQLVEYEKAQWECGELYYVPLTPLNYSLVTKLDDQIHGDGNFGGDVDFDITYGIELSPDKKQMYLTLSYIATECCTCHTPDFLCGSKDNSELGNNNSKWQSKKQRLLLSEAPTDYEFVQLPNLLEKTFRVNRRWQGPVLPIRPEGAYPFIKEFHVFGSNKSETDVIKMQVSVSMKSSGLLMKRTGTCTDVK